MKQILTEQEITEQRLQKERERREKNIGRYEIRCYLCGKVLKYTDNVPKSANCKDCGCSSFGYEMILPRKGR